MSTYIQLTLEVTTGADLVLPVIAAGDTLRTATMLEPRFVVDDEITGDYRILEGELIAWRYVPEEEAAALADPVCHCGTELSAHPSDHAFVEMR